MSDVAADAPESVAPVEPVRQLLFERGAQAAPKAYPPVSAPAV
ncbi:hypothetical protein ACIPSA_12615 [Streptomyces sp. NPDC086549]